LKPFVAISTTDVGAICEQKLNETGLPVIFIIATLVIARVLTGLLPQLFTAVTVKLPVTCPTVTVMLVVMDAPIHPAGFVHA
jgi:hypothetical protein